MISKDTMETNNNCVCVFSCKTLWRYGPMQMQAENFTFHIEFCVCVSSAKGLYQWRITLWFSAARLWSHPCWSHCCHRCHCWLNPPSPTKYWSRTTSTLIRALVQNHPGEKLLTITLLHTHTLHTHTQTLHKYTKVKVPTYPR